MNKLRVGVLMGGKSIEQEVSFNSGRTICDHLDTFRYDTIPLFQTSCGTIFMLPWHFLHRGKISDFAHRLHQEAREIVWDDLKQLVDFIYIATHGQFAEDGALQGFLELLDIPYLGADTYASSLRTDKIMQKPFLAMAGIDTPAFVALTPAQIATIDIDNLARQLEEKQIKAPYIVKPHKEGSSLGITVVFDESALILAIHKASTIHPGKKQSVLIEEKLEGMEFSCIILTDYKTGTLLPLPPTEIVLEPGTFFFDYEQKYMPGRATKITPARCSPAVISAIQTTCMKTMQELGITTIGRIDGFVTHDKRIVIIDPNSLSGMGPNSYLFKQAAEINMSHTQLINHLIETELHAYGKLEPIIQYEKEQAKTMNSHRIRVAILMGGRTNEKEISLESGRNITYKLSPQKYEAIPIFVTSKLELYSMNQPLLVSNSTKEIESLLVYHQAKKIKWHELKMVADFVFIGLHGGEGEDGRVQGALEMLTIPYNGSSILTSALCMDKFKTKQFLKYNGFDVPRGLLITKDSWYANKEEHIKKVGDIGIFPLIVKPHDDGCSVLVHKAENSAQLATAIELIFSNGKEHALIEEYINGMELTVGVIGNDRAQALPPSQAIAHAGILSIEEKFLPGAGENQTPAPLPQKTLRWIQETMEKVYTALRCKGYARIDCFYQTAEQSGTGKERITILEINSLPALTPATCLFHQAAEVGIKPMDFIDLIVQFGLEEHRLISVKKAQKEAIETTY